MSTLFIYLGILACIVGFILWKYIQRAKQGIKGWTPEVKK